MNEIDVHKLKMDRVTPVYAAPRKRRRRWRMPLLLAVLAAAGGAYYHYYPAQAVQNAQWAGDWIASPFKPAVQTTQVVSAWPSEQFLVLNSTGYVVPRRKAAVASKASGRVEWLGVDEGDHVKEGTVVARLESSDVRASHRAAVANVAVSAAALTTANTELADASRDFARVEALFRKGLVPETSLLDATSRVERAKASVESAQAALQATRANEEYARSAVDYTEIRAPFDGVVIARSVNVGDIVTPMSSAADVKGAVLTMADMSTLEVDADVSESSLSLVKVGQPAEITLDAYPARRFRGEVSVVVPSVNRASATVTTKVKFLDPDGTIMPDMSTRVGFLSQQIDPGEASPVMAVNPDAIVTRKEASMVFTITPFGKARAINVTVGDRVGTLRRVEGPVKVGDTLILKPGALKDGDSVKLPERS
ncbi:MAG: efflux RND transporter periplasmic adaptor subunit [Rhizobiaceae bacterium]